MLNDIKGLITHKKMDFLIKKGYSVQEDEYGVEYKKNKVSINVFWGRYYDPVDIVIIYENHNSPRCNVMDRNKTNIRKCKRKVVRLSNIVSRRHPSFLMVNDDIRRFEILSDYFIENINKLSLDYYESENNIND